jgi:hypothetical protein
VYLSVPLLNDIIQVGARGNLTTGTIRVSKTPTTATVRRTDGKPLQAQILHEHPGYIGPTVRTKVFREPVNCLRLQRIRSGDGHRLWLATEAVHVDRHQDLQQFVNTIATFALAKQRKMSGDEKPSSPITTRHVSLPIRHNDDSPTARRHPAPQFTGDADELEDVTPIPASSLGR